MSIYASIDPEVVEHQEREAKASVCAQELIRETESEFNESDADEYPRFLPIVASKYYNAALRWTYLLDSGGRAIAIVKSARW